MIKLSKHAIERMNERGITGDQLRHVLDKYTESVPYGNGFRLTARKDGRTFVVGVAKIGDEIIVTTVFEKVNYANKN